MALLQAKDISMHAGSRLLFEGLSFVIQENDRIAIIGANGSGKSTLLKLLARKLEPDSGEVIHRRELTVSYAPQSAEFPPGSTVRSYLDASLDDLSPVDRNRQISRWIPPQLSAVIDSPLDTLSGGQRKRAQLVAAFAREAQVLLLDEPTNQLDLAGILWLEDGIRSYRGAIAAVSHDRALIEAVASRTLELGKLFPGNILAVDGGYEEFRSRREEFLLTREEQYQRLNNKARRELEWLRRGPKAQTTKARSRVRAAEALQDEVAAFIKPDQKLGFDFSQEVRRTHDLIRIEGLAAKTPEKTLFEKFGFTLTPGMRLGIVGSNGSGKSTLLRLLAGELEPSKGRIARALGCQIAYFDQEKRTLNEDHTVRDALAPGGEGVVFNNKSIHVNGWAKRFLFRPEQLSTQVRMLSGGEKARLRLAQIMLTPADVLLLDEPTNDLDIPALEVLEEALREYLGALVMVSHDRYFLDQVCTHIVAIGEVFPTPEFFADTTQWQNALNDKSPKNSAEDKRDKNRTEKDGLKRRAMTYAERIELEGMESRIAETDGRIRAIEELLADPEVASDAARLMSLCEELEETRKRSDELYERWDLLEKKKQASEGEK